MTTMELALRVTDDTAIVALPAQIDASSEPSLTRAYQDAAGRASRVVLDFGRTEYINSTGIAVIVGLIARARKHGHQLAAYGLSEHYREIFEVTRLAEFLALFDDEAAALAGREGEKA